jgi:hypothetical protein
MIILFRFFPKKYIAMAIWPFIFVHDKSLKLDKTLINHEKIHFRQQIEMLWFLFFIWYTTEFFIRLAYHRNWDKAYKSISFEREAYLHEKNDNYLKLRRIWSFFKYL